MSLPVQRSLKIFLQERRNVGCTRRGRVSFFHSRSGMPVKLLLLDGVEFAGNQVLPFKTRMIFHCHQLPTVYQEVKQPPRNYNHITHSGLWSLGTVFHGSIFSSHSTQHKRTKLYSLLPTGSCQKKSKRTQEEGQDSFPVNPEESHLHFLLTSSRDGFRAVGRGLGLWTGKGEVFWTIFLCI